MKILIKRYKWGKDKWTKFLFMQKSKYLAPHLPETWMLTEDNFWNLITRYGQVILKPVGGSRGSGVIEVSSKENDDYKIHIENTRTTIEGREQTYSYINRIIDSRPYMVQCRIPLVKVDHRPFDMRVIVQRRKNSDVWKVTAKVAKVAGKGYFVTNITRSKGTLLAVETALQQSSLKVFSQKTLSEINRIALLSARRLSRLFPSHRIYGLDIGLDQNGHVWIIEANLYPAMSHFLKLEDKSMYRKIMEYKNG